MITTLAVWLVALPAAVGYGRLIIPQSAERDTVESETARAYAGLLVLSAILLIIAFFANLTIWWGVVAVIPGIVLSLHGRSLKSLPFSLCAIYACVALFVSLREVNFYDTALYHQQAVKWLAEYGLVRGLALVHFRFGWTSSWFALAAPLNHGVLAGRAAGVVGGLPFALVAVSSVRILFGFVRERAFHLHAAVWAIFGCLLTTVSITWNEDSSLSPDLLMWLLPVVVLTVLTDSTVGAPDRLGRAVLISALACVVKLNSAPVLGYCCAISLWYAARHKGDRLRLAAYGVPAALAIALLLAVNITTSGCPFLPSSIGCISVDWSVGTDAAARIQTEFFQFNHASRHNQVFPLTLAAAIASLLCIPRLRSPFLGHCLGICWVGITFLLVVAPVPRYGLGYFLLPVAAGSACILDWLDTRIDLTLPAIARRFWSVPGASMLFAPAILFAALAVLVLRGWGLGEFLYPRRLASASGDPIHIVNRVLDANGRLLLRQENRGSLTVWVPVSSDQCWDAPLPCTPTLTRDSVSLRRPGSLEAGFVGHQGQD